MSGKKDFLLEDDKDKIEIVKEPEKEKVSALVKARRQMRKNIFVTSAIMFFVSLAFIALGLVWQRRYDLWAWSNALWLAFSLEFFLAWIFFVYNKNILSPLIHGFKVFGLMIVGKRSKESYYDYSMRIEENPIPKFVYYTIFIFALLLFIPALITLLIQL